MTDIGKAVAGVLLFTITWFFLYMVSSTGGLGNFLDMLDDTALVKGLFIGGLVVVVGLMGVIGPIVLITKGTKPVE